MQLIHEGQPAKGRAFLKRVAEEFSDEEGIRIQLGQIFTAAGQYTEAAEMYEEAMQAQPREAAAYTGAVAAWLKLREFEKRKYLQGHSAHFRRPSLHLRQNGKNVFGVASARPGRGYGPARPAGRSAAGRCLEVMAVLDKK